MKSWLGRLWHGMRHLLGDGAYERYLAHQHRKHPDRTPLTREAFYRDDVERRWSGINRCC